MGVGIVGCQYCQCVYITRRDATPVGMPIDRTAYWPRANAANLGSRNSAI